MNERATVIKLLMDMDVRLRKFSTKLGSRRDAEERGKLATSTSCNVQKNENILLARRRLAKVCSREYPFHDAAAAAAMIDARNSEYIVSWSEVLVTTLWMFRFLFVLMCGLASGFLTGLIYPQKTFGIEMKYAVEEENCANKYFAKRLEVALKKYEPAAWPFCNGDWRTLLPFLLFKVKAVQYERWWLRVPACPYRPNKSSGATQGVASAAQGQTEAEEDPSTPFQRSIGENDDEACALDIAWPNELNAKCSYLVLHGLNGGSDDMYVIDFVREANAKGSAVAVLINRGLMHTPVRGSKSIFHGARTCDVGAALDAFRLALGDNHNIAIVGWSMGGILATNFVVAAGSKANCIAAISICGALSSTTILQKYGDRSRKLWQLPLTTNLKKSFLAPNIRKLKLKDQGNFFDQKYLTSLQNAHTVDAFDKAFVCTFVGFPTLLEYYNTMSAIGAADSQGCSRFAHLKCPLLVLHADDDPIIPHQVNHPDLAIKASPFAFFLSTKVGGHVGFSTKNSPLKSRWAFPIDAAITFASAACDFKHQSIS